MTGHPADAATVAELGVDYLIDRTRADRAEHGFDADPHASPDPRALAETVRARLRAAGELTPDARWRVEIDSLLDAGPTRTQALGAMVLRREGARPFDPRQPLAANLPPDAQAILDALAIERQGTATPSGDTAVPLAAPLRPRPGIPPRGSFRPGAVEVVEIGDLGDSFSCQAHTTVYDGLGDLRDAVRWRWLYCATPRTLPASHRAGAIAEAVADHVPGSFWNVVGTLASRGLDEGSEHATAVLLAAGADPDLGRPPLDGTPLPPGLLDDRTMATVCGLPRLRPLFAVGRTLFAGTDAADRLRRFLASGGPR